ncbi:copper resistance protein CopC [Actinobacteria bacterium IMCC26103]|nr:copper resistance protein CopC [Actinobacteria bacterium IMCC26103]
MKISKFPFAAGILAISLIALPASAHTVLITANPVADSSVDVLPVTISLTFAEELVGIVNSNSISVIDESGTELSTGKPEVNGAVLSINLAPTEVNGLIKVSYRAVAADGHVITGEYQFTVSPKAIAAIDENAPTLFAQDDEFENKISIYLIISSTLVVGGALLLFFIWKRQSK